jgi:beta-lactamase regulating signal transducer with metallopeptidase domain
MAAAVSWVLRDSRDVFRAAFGAFSRGSAPAAVTALWQGAAVALTLALCLRLAPRVSAAHRFAVWAAGFAAAAGLPFLTLLARFNAGAHIAAAAPLHVAAAKPWFQLDSRWGFAIAALWLAASILRAAGLGLHSLRLRKLWKTATPIQDAASLAVKVSARRPIEICATRHLDRPSVIGFFAPRILIPDWLCGRLTPAELEQVVLHEAEHLRRHDDWMNLFQKLALVLFPLNPALAWMERRLCREREMACDEGVVQRTQAPRAYAACLTSLAERRLQRGAARGRQRNFERRAEALSLGAWQRRSELVRRVHSILRSKQSLHPLAARVLIGVVGCGLLVASVELACCPQVVAFVTAPRPHKVEIAQLQPVSVPAAYAPQAASVFRAIQAKATLPRNALAAVTVGDALVYHAARRPQPVVSSEVASREAAGEPRQQLIKSTAEATLPSASAFAGAADQDSEPQAGAPSDRSSSLGWKAGVPNDRSSSLGWKAGAPSDRSSSLGCEYFVLTAWIETRTSTTQAGGVADYDTGAPVQPQSSQPATQITVTRLILAVYPIVAAPAPGASSQNPSSSKPVRPPAPPVASGWLIFQL